MMARICAIFYPVQLRQLVSECGETSGSSSFITNYQYRDLSHGHTLLGARKA
jgi:hypothetical protein